MGGGEGRMGEEAMASISRGRIESQLIDYDVYSNQGNWLYIAGKGTDPRGGRPFNVGKQARDYDPDGVYQKMWLNENTSS